MGEFGDKFRKAREAKKMSLDDVSNVTKISARMLQAIEEEKFDILPGGVFNKGFIRAYAKHLGINDEEAVTDYLACLRRAQVEAQAAWEPPARVPVAEKRWPVKPNRGEGKAHSSTQVEELPELHLPREEQVRPPRQKYLDKNDGGISWRLWAVVALVLVLALVLWRRHSRNAGAENVASPPPPVPVTQTATAAGAAQTSDQASAPAAARGGAGTAGAAATHAPPPSKPSSPVKPPAADGRSAPAESTKPADDKDNNAPAPPVEAAPVETTSAPITLVIRATENSWISVSADGKTVNQETLIAPANTSVRASREIVARVGNAAGVTFLWNGKEIPAQGEEAEVKTFVFDAGGMRVITPGQSPAQNQ